MSLNSTHDMDYLKSLYEKKTPRAPKRNVNSSYAKPLPLETFPLPAFFPSNPFSYLRIAYALFSTYLNRSTFQKTVYPAYYSPVTRSVHVTDEVAAQVLWRSGFFGKGSLSRSEPEWLEREKRRLAVSDGASQRGGTAAEVTRKRREGRREEKRERARVQREELEEQLRVEGKLVEVKVEVNGAANGAANGSAIPNGSSKGPVEPKEQTDGSPTALATRPLSIKNTSSITTNDEALANHQKAKLILEKQEHLQLTSHETLFLAYGLGVLQVYPEARTTSEALSNHELLMLFRRTSTFPPLPTPNAQTPLPPDDRFILHYIVFHHFRSLGWVVRPGIKFAVDLLLYARGPVFAHAEFAVIILPSYSRWPDRDVSAVSKDHEVWREQGEWWWLHAVNRVQNQVLKSLVLVYVEVPTPKEVAEDAAEIADIGQLLKRYSVREFVIKRWTPNRNRG